MPLVIAGCGSNTELSNEGSPENTYTKAFLSANVDFSGLAISAGNPVYNTANDSVLNNNEYLIRKYSSFSECDTYAYLTAASCAKLRLNVDYYNNPLEPIAGSSLNYTFGRLMPVAVYDVFSKHYSGAVVRSWVNFTSNSTFSLNKTSSAIPSIVETIYVKLYNDSSATDIDTDIYHRIPATAISGLLSQSIYSIAGDTTANTPLNSFNPFSNSIDDLRKILKDNISTDNSITSDTNKLYAVGMLALKEAACAQPYIDYSVQPYIDNGHCTVALNDIIKNLTMLQYHTVIADSLYGYMHDTDVAYETSAANNLGLKIATICANQSVTDTVIGPFSYISAATADSFGAQLQMASKSNLISFIESLSAKNADLYFTVADSLTATGIPVNIAADTALFFYNYNSGAQSAISVSDVLIRATAQLDNQCYTKLISDANIADMFGLADLKSGLKSAKPSLFKTFKIKSGL